MSGSRKRVAVLISGRGSNMAALIEAAKQADCPFEIVLVLCDQPQATGLKIAEANGIPAACIERPDFPDRAAHEAEIEEALKGAAVEFVALAGYMRLLSPAFVQRWTGRLVNIHPALLPSFPGLDTHRRVLEAGVRIHGCTVHFVTADVDAGPIIAQAAAAVPVDDDEASLARRILKLEHQLYSHALSLLCRSEARMIDGKTAFSGRAEPAGSDDRPIISPSLSQRTETLEALARFTP